jgi:hypothetical protein
MTQKSRPSPRSDPYADFANSTEAFVQRVQDEVVPALRDAHLTDCASALVAQIEAFDGPEWDLGRLGTDDRKRSIDKSAKAVADMHKTLYRELDEKTTFEHATLLQLIKEIAEEYRRGAYPALKQHDLGYYEFDKLDLTLEQKLGLDIAPVVDTGPRQRQRRLPKDPDKIENALLDCLRTIVPLRDKIQTRQGKFDELVARVCTELLTGLPERDLLAKTRQALKTTSGEAFSGIPKEGWERMSDKDLFARISAALTEIPADRMTQMPADDILSRARVAMIWESKTTIDSNPAALVDHVANVAGARRAQAKTAPAPEGKAEGQRVKSLIAATKTLIKIGKWVRQVDLMETERSESRKLEVMRKLDKLTSLAKGQDIEVSGPPG